MCQEKDKFSTIRTGIMWGFWEYITLRKFEKKTERYKKKFQREKKKFYVEKITFTIRVIRVSRKSRDVIIFKKRVQERLGCTRLFLQNKVLYEIFGQGGQELGRGEIYY
jgi:hypothetical protein